MTDLHMPQRFPFKNPLKMALKIFRNRLFEEKKTFSTFESRSYNESQQ